MSCPRFVQNAWKRDLCSNCFKGKEEHAPVVDNRARYLASLKDLGLRPPPPGILKGLTRKNVAAFKVHFPSEESQVIGYGGEDFSDLEDEEDAPLIHRNGKREGSPSEDSPEEEEDYRNFQKLTDSNTEFNKDPANLLSNKPATEKPASQVKKTTTAPLKLGQVQSNGKKSTLLVSVQPFGSPANSTPLAVSRKTHLNNLLHDATDSLKLSDNVEVKSNLSSVTIKTDTVNDNKTELVFDKDSNPKIINETRVVTINNGVVANSLVSIVDNINEELETKPVDDESDKKTEKQAEDRLSSLIEGKKSQITRGTMLTKSHEQKTKRYFQLGSVKSDEESPISESVMKKLEAKERSLHNSFSKAKDTISIKSLQQKNIKNTANGLFSSRLLKKEFGIQSDLQLTKIKPLEYIDSNLSAIEPNVEKESNNKSSEVNPVSIVSFTKLTGEDVMEKDGLLLIDGVPTESREMAGEPDGRADSDDLDEPPPDLPTTPPPNLTDHIPRPSFLHNIAKEKPKLPVKPKLREKSPPKDLVLDHVQLDETLCDPNLSPNSCRSLITKRQAPKPPPTPLGESPPKYSPTEGSPVERRERASSCSPLPSDSSSNSSQTPEPPTRRSLSLSHETLASNGTPFPIVIDKKKGNKMRSTIRKFLRLASREEFKCEELGAPPLPPPRPRPEIIHPLDLNKSAVQVLRSDGTPVSAKPPGSVPESPSSPTTPTATGFYSRPNKPPPPPRSQSLDSALGLDTRPVRPPPPNKQLLTTTSQPATPTPTPTTNGHSVYVNLGEVRSAIAPAKPQRTASLREKENSEPIYQTSSVLQMTENLYESLAPECDLSRERSSLPYYGSETESDIYCPYTFANSHKQGDELRPCKSRSVVHKSLEDNYGAVVVANHEALTQLLEQTSTRPIAPPGVRALRANSSLQWTDFTVEGGVGGEVEVAGRVFLSASYGPHPLTLCLTPGQARLPPCLAPVTQFFDLVASQFLQKEKTELVQVSVAVLARQEFLTFMSFCEQQSHDQLPDVAREAALLLVQIVNSLKCLQAQGREEASLAHFVLSRDDKRTSPRVCLLPHDSNQEENTSLCQCALKAAESLCLPPPLMDMLRSVLGEERATSLTQAKATLELWLWGPTHIPVSPDKQTSLQRWLDLERATVLHSLVVRRPLTLSCGDFYHLSFLVQTNAKVMSDALEMLDRHNSTSS